MDINLLTWSFLIIFMLHNFEEIIVIERWFKTTYPRVVKRIPPFARKEIESFRSITSAQFSVAVCVLFIPASVLILITVITNQYFLFLGLNIFFALNILTHPVQSLVLKSYVPGLWTTIVLILPYNVLVFTNFHKAGMLNAGTMISALVVTILFIPILMISHKIAEKWG